MRVTLAQIVDAFDLLYENIHNRQFRKTLSLNWWSERELLPLVRAFLLGYFGVCAPEVKVKLPGSSTGRGLVDFKIGNVAVELAVRRPDDRKSPLSAAFNTTEIKKLMMHPGPSILILYDFSRHPFDDDDLERYRDYPSLGKGNFAKSGFNLAYFYLASGSPIECDYRQMNIRL
jgi:hypothetical protein